MNASKRAVLSILLMLGITTLASAQIGTVKTHQKISDTEGNFTGLLDDGDWFGSNVTPIGDLNGDGVTDLAVGANKNDDGGTDWGAIWILFMNADGTVQSHQKISATEGGFTGQLSNDNYFGRAIAPLGDLDGDGVVDLAAGAALDPDGGSIRGAVWVLFLNQNGTVKNHQKISDTQGGFTGVLLPDNAFGLSVASLGDLDGDGVTDLAVGAAHDDDGGTDHGAVWILFLNQNGTVKNHQKISDTAGGFTGTLEDNDIFGSSLANLGDLDGDTVIDLAVGSHYDDDGGTDRGAVWILFLNQNGTVKNHQKISNTQGNFSGILDDSDWFGYSTSAPGDMDGDGVLDVIVGASRDDDGGTDRGAAWILFLNQNGTVKAHQKISDLRGFFHGSLANGDEFGWSVSAIGDLNGDGSTDLAVGAPKDEDGGIDRGAVWILFLNPPPSPGVVLLDENYDNLTSGNPLPGWTSGAYAQSDDSRNGTIGAKVNTNIPSAYATFPLTQGVITFEVWMRPEASSNTNNGLHLGSDVVSPESTLFWKGSDGVWWYHQSPTEGAQQVSFGTYDGAWHYFKAIYSTQTNRYDLYMDGIQVANDVLWLYDISGGISKVGFNSGRWGYATDTTSYFDDLLVYADPLLSVSIPDTVASYASTITVPVRITDTSGLGIVASELNVASRKDIVLSAVTDITTTENTITKTSLVYQGWSIEENVLSGGSAMDTLTIAMSTAQDTLQGAGDLIYLTLQTADIRHPDSTALQIVHALFNDGNPSAITINGSLKLIGADGVIDAQPDSIYPRNTISITLTDIDLDLDVDTPDQVTVTATGSDYADVEPVSLMETGNSTGIFTGSIPTAFSASGVASGDGVIASIAGDSIIVSYTDVLSAVGNTETRTDKVSVIGGVDAQLVASYVIQALNGRNDLRDIVRLRVTDLDPGLDVNTADQVSVTTTNTALSETEVISLPETGLFTGIFQDSLLTQAGSSGVNNDGTVVLPTTASALDSLITVYIDTLNAAGGYDTLSATTYVINLFGDVSADDRVGAFDAAQILANAVNLRPFTFREDLAGDVDGSGEILAIDASLVLQYVVRLIDAFPVQTDTDITLPDDPKNHPFLKPVPPDQIIALGDLQSQSDGTVLLPVHLAEREGILSGTITLGVDPGVEVLSVTSAPEYSRFMTAHNTTNESVKIAFAGSKSDLTGPGDLLCLKIRQTGDAPIRLSLNQVYLNGHSLTPTVNIEVMEAVEAQENPLVTQLYQNVPNPFNPQTTIRYDLAESGQVNIVIYSITGQRIRSLVSKFQDTGSYQLTWDGMDALGQQVSSGLYLVRMTSNGFIKTHKMLLLR